MSSNTEIRYKMKLTLGAKRNQTGMHDKFGREAPPPPSCGLEIQVQLSAVQSVFRQIIYRFVKEEDHKHAIAAREREVKEEQSAP